ncbi:CPBP family intramembrane glutamic endopeptidase [Actinoplanes sp. N902-109]|uniref:CPBP family intramembrane glutamic endopeptidase n=1 Tax=Actinoplanes sp. (strain N902-109) TaxID=649831 RepID=UPI0003293BFD|nr:CPBP family intramembrane glutamic endopeptidase [Actinoplanes sp. N902-109]AGL21576.1 abortive infection protein [Actinoplanes sp. N902-109]
MTVNLDRPPATRSQLRWEIAIVLLLSLGQSAVYAVVSLVAKLTAGKPLSQQTATLNPSQSPRPYLDLTYQLLGIIFALIPVLLALYLLNRDRPALGIDFRRPAADLGWGTALAAAIGIPGLLLVYVAAQLGLNARIIPAALQPVWWAVPVLILSAIQNAVLEEVIVVGYLITRLRTFSWRLWWIVAASAVLRGSYHLYQGFGAFVGNAVMGVIFALFFLRKGRVMPLVVAHSILDIAAFVGYTLLPDSWLTWL